jgi:hypothetical protein
MMILFVCAVLGIATTVFCRAPGVTLSEILASDNFIKIGVGWNRLSRTGKVIVVILGAIGWTAVGYEVIGMLNMKAQDAPFLIFFVIMGAICAVDACYFVFNKNAAQKRKVLPYSIIGIAVLLLGFVVFVMPTTIAFALPGIMFVSYVNFRMIRFCDACGTTLFRQNPYTPPRYCSKCGAKMENWSATQTLTAPNLPRVQE